MDNDIDLKQMLATLWREKIWIILTCIIGLAIGGYYAFVIAVPKYSANSVVMLESRQEQVVDLGSVVSGLSADQSSINTELEVLRARALLAKLVHKMDLTNDPEFNTRLRPKEKYSINAAKTYVRNLIKGATKEPAKAAVPPSAQTILDSTISRVLGAIKVSNIRQSYVFRINAVTESPEKSAAIANQLAKLYILDQLEGKFEATEQATNWLTARVAELQISLEQAESAVKEFNAGTELVSLEALTGMNRQIKDMRERQASAERSIKEKTEQLALLQTAQNENDREKITVLANDRSLDRILSMIADGDVNAESTFDARVQNIIARADLDLQRAVTQNAALTSSIVEQNARIERQSNDLLELQQLRRESEASRLIYEYFLGRLKETSVQQGIQRADSRLLSPAVIPGSAVAPKKTNILALSLVLSLFVSMVGVLAHEMLKTGIRTAEQLEELTGKTVMGQIPMVPARRRKNVLKYLVEKPNSAAAEAVRNLRTSTLLSNLDNPPKVIMSTSSLPGEGKTTQSLALTQNFSGLGKKVLLIEGDIRRRVFSQYFDIDENHGFLSVLSGDVTLEDAVVFNKELGADVLVGEKSTLNAADIFSSKTFAEFIKKARDNYDIVIIDTPPVLVVPDARVIGQSVDAILYTVKWDHTTGSQILEGLRMFETVNLKVTGLVLGQIDSKTMKRYGYGTYGSQYYHN